MFAFSRACPNHDYRAIKVDGPVSAVSAVIYFDGDFNIPANTKTFNQYWYNVDPASQTVGHYYPQWANISSVADSVPVLVHRLVFPWMIA